jgi:hypothetical protein
MARLSRTRLRKLRVTALLLPVFMIRALIPAGFMPGVDASGIPTLQLCSGYMPAQSDVQGHAAHHTGHAQPHSGVATPHAGHDGSDGSGHEQQGACPFSASATPDRAPTVFAFTSIPAQIVFEAVTGLTRLHIPTTIRAHPPRAPPGLV